MTRATDLKSALDAINLRQSQLDSIQKYIQQIKINAEQLQEEQKKQAMDIYTKATLVYETLLKDHEYYNTHNGAHTKKEEELNHYVAVTEALLSAQPGDNRRDALIEFIKTANETSNTKYYIGIAMLALGLALVGAAVVIGICLLTGAWPALAITANMGEMLINGILAPLFIAVMGTFATGLGIAGGFSIFAGIEPIQEKRHNKDIGIKMSELHNTFFSHDPENNKRITDLSFVPAV